MPVVMSEVGPTRSQGPWDRRNVAELSRTNFRTTLRGFDPDEVRATLDSVAADYRVLQLQNASLKRQLANLESILQAYYGDSSANGAAVREALQRATGEARAILTRAQAEAEDTMARIAARVHDADAPAAAATARAVAPAPAAPHIEAPRATSTGTPAPPAAPANVPAAVVRPDLQRSRDTRKPPVPDWCDDLESMQSLLRNIDRALVEIPAVPCR